MKAQSCADHAVDAATGKALAMVAIEMILTLGHQLGKGFDLAAYAKAIADVDDGPDAPPEERQARANVSAILMQLSQATVK